MRKQRRLVVGVLLAILVLGWTSADAGPPQAKLLNNRDGLLARAQLVMNAKREINASVFIFTSDRLGQMGLAMLRRKVREGVKVRLLVEPMGRTNLHPPIPRALLAALAEEGVEVKFYNPPRGGNLARFWRLGRRMHDKVLSVDDEELIVGGRNLGETYFGMRPAPDTPIRKGKGNSRPYRDLDAYASGPAAADAGRYFRELFDAAHVRTPWNHGVTRAAIERAKASLDYYDKMLDRPRVASFLREDWRAGMRNVNALRFIHDPVSLKQKAPRTIEAYTELMDSAQREVIISSAYGLPTKRMMELIRRTLARGIKVKLMVNSRRSNEPLLQAAYELAAPKLAEMGVEIWEYQGREMMHVKAVLVDGVRGYVGSYNIDASSEKKNTETGMTFNGPELAADLAGYLGAIEKDSKRVTESGRLIPHAWAPHESIGRKILWPIMKNASRIPILWDRL